MAEKQITEQMGSCRGILLAIALSAIAWSGQTIAADAADKPVVDADPAAGLEPLDRTALEASEELRQRMAGLANLQSDLGMYDPALVEAYADLADFYADQGEHGLALEMHREAMQVARINLGLNSEQQLPFINGMIDASLALKDWQKADDMNQLRFYLKERIYEPGDLRYADAVAELGEWKWQVISENLLGSNLRSLSRQTQELSNIYWRGINRIQESPDYRATNLLPLLEGKSRVDLEFARYVADTPYQYFEGYESPYISERVCTNVQAENGQIVRSCTTIQRENPRYRDSQRDAKRNQVDQVLREVQYSLRQMDSILASGVDVPSGELERLESDMRRLQAEYDQVARTARRRALF